MKQTVHHGKGKLKQNSLYVRFINYLHYFTNILNMFVDIFIYWQYKVYGIAWWAFNPVKVPFNFLASLFQHCQNVRKSPNEIVNSNKNLGVLILITFLLHCNIVVTNCLSMLVSLFVLFALTWNWRYRECLPCYF